MAATISVVIIAKNAMPRIKDCLNSVLWADEIIVLDSGSSDDTVATCHQYGAHVWRTDWPGFGKQKNRAIAKASCDWILSLDADEVVTAKLQAAIKQTIQKPRHRVYRLRRRSYFLGQAINYGDWRKDIVIRLFQRGFAHFDDKPVHEAIQHQGPSGQLDGLLDHYTNDSIEQALTKMVTYAKLGAQRRSQEGKRGGLRPAISHGLWSFIRGYMIKRGFLDGRAGFIIAALNAQGSYYKYLLTEESKTDG